MCVLSKSTRDKKICLWLIIALNIGLVWRLTCHWYGRTTFDPIKSSFTRIFMITFQRVPQNHNIFTAFNSAIWDFPFLSADLEKKPTFICLHSIQRLPFNYIFLRISIRITNKHTVRIPTGFYPSLVRYTFFSSSLARLCLWISGYRLNQADCDAIYVYIN